LEIARTVSDLRTHVSKWRLAGEVIGLVPTMGALHAGHLSLIKIARTRCDRVVATIFVNPRQFLPHEDYESYPRTEKDDIDKLIGEGADLLFSPINSEMYQPDAATSVTVSNLTNCLCGTTRPGFFDGVATVVTKLLLQTLPNVAVFGEKDYQQLLVIKRLTTDLDIPVEIIGGPTIRESDGLAVSSRNIYLKSQARRVAPNLFRILTTAAEAIASGDDLSHALLKAKYELQASGFTNIDYLDARNSKTLVQLSDGDTTGRIFASVWLDTVRLIDNVLIEKV